jgi:hypothetical protein
VGLPDEQAQIRAQTLPPFVWWPESSMATE